MLHKHSLIVLTALLCLPWMAHAEESTVLQLKNPGEQGQWNQRKLTNVVSSSEGLHVTTVTDGTLLRPLSVSHGIDVVEFTYVSPRGGPFSLLWQERDGGNSYYQLPLKLNASPRPQSFVIALSAVGNWVTRPSVIGFSLPVGTDILISSIRLRGWNPMEKLIESAKCFWTFDLIAPHSINFLWGPLLCSSPVARSILYDNAPPIAHSGMRFIYAVLGLGLLILAWRAWRSDSNKKTFVRQALLLIFILWAVLDVRMGGELLRNWTTDIRMYVSEPAGRRAFRSLEFFPDFSEVVRPLLTDQKKYVLVSNFPERYIRYYTWPSQPVAPAAGSGALHWLVYDRKDVTIDAQGRLTEKGVPISPPGKIIHEFIEGTFVFRVNP